MNFDLHNLTNQGGRTNSAAAGEGARSWVSGGWGGGSDGKEKAEPGSGSARPGSGPIPPRLNEPGSDPRWHTAPGRGGPPDGPHGSGGAGTGIEGHDAWTSSCCACIAAESTPLSSDCPLCQ